VRNLHILTHKLGKQLNRLDLTDTIMIEEQGLVTGLPSRIPRSVC
jgi:D-ribose pyranose/furanose isomerase RbsD